jgi:hypothetical protein
VCGFQSGQQLCPVLIQENTMESNEDNQWGVKDNEHLSDDQYSPRGWLIVEEAEDAVKAGQDGQNRTQVLSYPADLCPIPAEMADTQILHRPHKCEK